jgi:hypothetical protein
MLSDGWMWTGGNDTLKGRNSRFIFYLADRFYGAQHERGAVAWIGGDATQIANLSLVPTYQGLARHYWIYPSVGKNGDIGGSDLAANRT